MRRRILSFLAVGAALLVMSVAGCVHLALPLVSTDLDAAEARPEALGAFGDDAPISTAEDWTERRAPLLRAAFEREIYGRMPVDGPLRILSQETVDAAALDGAARLEEVTVAVGEEDQEFARFTIALLTPNRGDGPFPTIIAQSFCGNQASMGRADLSPPLDGSTPCDSAIMKPVILTIFGAHALRPPLEDIIDRGYAYAATFAVEVAPDSAGRAGPALHRLSTDMTAEERPGVIAAWAWTYSRTLDYVDQHADLDASRTAVWGHSRNGKAALLAGAYDERVDAVIAHQSGTGGATLARGGVGESIEQITDSYPHWFNSTYATYAGREDALTVDQHQLIALIAPRPVLLGNAWRDRWSDPNGAYRALMGADAVYELFGEEGLDQDGLTDFNPAADLSFFMRRGNHGVTRADWRAFMAFLDAHFGTGQSGRLSD